jgi:hypothetical protein
MKLKNFENTNASEVAIQMLGDVDTNNSDVQLSKALEGKGNSEKDQIVFDQETNTYTIDTGVTAA